MNDLDDAKLKIEIDEIMKRIDIILKKVENHVPVRKKESIQDEDYNFPGLHSCQGLRIMVYNSFSNKQIEFFRRHHGINKE